MSCLPGRNVLRGLGVSSLGGEAFGSEIWRSFVWFRSPPELTIRFLKTRIRDIPSRISRLNYNEAQQGKNSRATCLFFRPCWGASRFRGLRILP